MAQTERKGRCAILDLGAATAGHGVAQPAAEKCKCPWLGNIKAEAARTRRWAEC